MKKKLKGLLLGIYSFSPRLFRIIKNLMPLALQKRILTITRTEQPGTLENTASRLLDNKTYLDNSITDGKARYKLESNKKTKNKGQLYGLVYGMELRPWLRESDVCGEFLIRKDKIATNIGEYSSKPMLNILPYVSDREKLLIVLPSFWRGGTEKATLDLVQGLMKSSEKDVWVVACGKEYDQDIYESFIATGANIVYFSGVEAEFPYLRALEDLVVFIKPDYYLIANSQVGYFALPFLKKSVKCRTIDVLHSEAPLGGSKEFEEFLDEHIAVSEYIKKFFEKHYSPEKTIRVIYNAVDTDVFSFKKRTGKIRNVIFLGRLSEEKRPLDFVKIAEQMADKLGPNSPSFSLYGEGPERKAILSYISKHRLNGVTLEGFTKKPESVLSEADCLILTSVNESYGLVVAEAMATGTIVISSNVGIGSEIITNGVNGFIVECGNIKGFAETLQNVISLKPAELNEIRDNAHRIIYEKDLYFVKMIEGYLKALNS